MADVYLSYAQQDHERAERIAGALTRSGWTLARRQVAQPRQQTAATVSETLLNAKCVLVLWSHNSTSSPFVQMEALAAQHRNVVVHVLTEPMSLPTEFADPIVNDLTHWHGSVHEPLFKQLADAIRHYAAPSPAPAIATEDSRVQIVDRETDLREDLGGGHVVITLLAPSTGSIRWLVKAWTRVQRGDPVAEISNAGATTYLRAPDQGPMENTSPRGLQLREVKQLH